MDGAQIEEGGTGTSSITIVRIKRRRDDPAEPQIILEAAGACRNKQPRYDEVLLQFQGFSVMSTASAKPPRRRFRRLHTVEVSVLEAMSEAELHRLLCAQTGTAETAAQPASPEPLAAAAAALREDAPAERPQRAALPVLAAHAPPPDREPVPAPRRSVKGSHGPTPESRIAALRSAHRQAAVAARFKQIRRKRGTTAGEGGEAAGLLHMYDLERLPAENKAAVELRPGCVDGREPSQPLQQQQQSGAAQPAPREQPLQRQQQRGVPAAEAEAGPAITAEEALIQRYGPLMDEVLRSLNQQQPQEVRRIPARPKRAQGAATASPHRPQSAAASRAAQPNLTSASATADASASTAAAASEAVGAAGAPPQQGPEPVSGQGAARRRSDDADSFVYDVYVPVHDGEEVGDRGDGAEDEDLWPWLDVAAGVDAAAPVIEVAENDDEFFWAGELEAEAAAEAAADHDSEDSNAESFYANSYPDEEAQPYDGLGGEGATGEDDDDEYDGEAGPADVDVGGEYGWGSALAMRQRDPVTDDEDDGEEMFGRRGRRRGCPAKTGSSYYRTEGDDYSEHSSYLSEDEERREAEERRRRTMFMH